MELAILIVLAAMAPFALAVPVMVIHHEVTVLRKR